MTDIVRRCKWCGKLVHDGMMNMEGFYAHEDCFKPYMNEVYGPDGWRSSEDELEDCGFYAVKEGEDWVDTGIFYTDFEDDDCVEYVALLDGDIPKEVDNFTAPEGYTLAEYLDEYPEWKDSNIVLMEVER